MTEITIHTEALEQLRESLIRASYHYADDTTREWKYAKKYVTLAAEIIVGNSLTDTEVREVFKDTKPLLTLQELKTACMNIKDEEPKHES